MKMDYDTYQRSDNPGKAIIMRMLFDRLAKLEEEVAELKGRSRPPDAIGKLMPLTAKCGLAPEKKMHYIPD